MYFLKRNNNQYLEILDDYVDYAQRKGRHFLPHIARFLLVSTFLDDSIRMLYDHNTQVSYFKYQWNSSVAGYFFLLFNMITQFVGSVGVIFQKRITESAILLVVNLVVQFFVYMVYMDMHLFMRFLSLIGGLTLSVTEWRATVEKENTVFTGQLFEDKKSTSSSIMSLVGRIICILMYLTLIELSLSVNNVVFIMFGIVLLPCIVVGYRAKAASLILGVWLMVDNFVYNSFWSFTGDRFIDDYAKYDFFQTLSVIGGLLYITCMGAGSISVDAYKKKF